MFVCLFFVFIYIKDHLYVFMAQVLLILKHWQSKQADSLMIHHHAGCSVLSLLPVCAPGWHAIASQSTTCRKNVPHMCRLVLITLYLYNSLKNIHWKTKLHAWHLFFKGQVKIKYLQCLINNCLLEMSLGCRGIAPHSHEFSCGWRRMVSFIPWLLYACGNFQHQLDWRLSWYKHHWDMKVLRKFFASARIWMSVLLPVVWSLVTEILWLFLRM